MSVSVEEFREQLESCAPELRDTLDGIVHEASRLMSSQGLADYLAGARGFCELGRGKDLVVTYLEEMPAVVRECGEDVIRDCVSAAMKLSSMTSGAVLALLFASLPTAARRLGDPELLRAYLALVHRLASKAPRGVRPMLEHVDELLSKVTLTGLRQWVDFGAEAYRSDLAGQARYFALETEDSRAMLRKVRRGTLFVDVQRKLNFYLRALWGRDFFVRPTIADYEGFRPYIEHGVLHVPDAVDAAGGVGGLDLYRAMVAHMAAHLVYTPRPQEGAPLAPAQRWFVGLVEDARIEHCAVTRFPGLRTLWRTLLDLERPGPVEHESLPVIERVALALLDPEVEVGDAELDALVRRFHEEIDAREDEPEYAWHLGLELHNVFARRRALPSLRILEKMRVPYRDDNRFIWERDAEWWAQQVAYVPESQRQVRKYVSAVDMAFEVDVENAGDDAQEVWICRDEFFDDDGVSFNEKLGKEPVSEPFHYHEWDYRVQLYRPDWVTVYERRQHRGDPEAIDAILVEHKPVSFRIRRIIDRLRPQGLIRERKLEDGDEIDINAAVDAMVELRAGRSPDPRITYRNVIRRRDLAVVILLDLSESTNDEIEGAEGKTVLDLTREACALVATAIEGIGDAYAIHGFASDGRHDVHYYRFKDFDQRLDDEVKSRLAGMAGGLSTRMGAALRHAAMAHLARRSEKHRLVLLVTDGEPADIDERDPQYLRVDTKKAVEELHTMGVITYCLTLDPNADQYVQRIFGPSHYTIIDHVQRLPERLPLLFASLTR